MISSWMLYAAAVGALITIAALAADQGLKARALPTRFVWIGALVLSVLWPLGPAIRKFFPAPAPVSVLPFSIVVQAPAVIAQTSIAERLSVYADRGAIVLWLVLSAALLARLAYGVVRLQRMRNAWRRARVEGMSVKLSDNVGPAVIGLRSMEVVLPEWILSLDSPLRAIVLRHEDEHRQARDPLLLFAAAVLVALMPWNALLWFHAKRLRLAIELDCDARVLRAHPSPERYGMLMLTIAQRRSVSPALFAPMLTEPTTQLERRIIAMRKTTRKLARLTMYGSGVVAMLVLAFASSLQSAAVTTAVTTLKRPFRALAPDEVRKLPAAVTMAPRVTKPAPVSTPVAAPVDSPEVRTFNKVVITGVSRTQEGNPAPRYPDMLRSANVEGAVVVQFQSDERGNVDMSSFRVIRSTHDLFTNSVKATLPNWHVAPNSSFQMPFLFLLSTQTAKELRGTNAAGISIDGISGANGVTIVAAPDGVERPAPADGNRTYFEFQVEKQASPMPGNPAPRYPDLLREARIEGEVLGQFVLNEDGTPDVSTFKVLRSDNELFSDAVKSALANMRFYPAQVGGHAVKQLVQMPFQFNLTKN